MWHSTHNWAFACCCGESTPTLPSSHHSHPNRVWDDELLQDAVNLLSEEFPLQSDVPGGMPDYRRSLAVSFFFKFFWCVRSQLPGMLTFGLWEWLIDHHYWVICWDGTLQEAEEKKAFQLGRMSSQFCKLICRYFDSHAPSAATTLLSHLSIFPQVSLWSPVCTV